MSVFIPVILHGFIFSLVKTSRPAFEQGGLFYVEGLTPNVISIRFMVGGFLLTIRVEHRDKDIVIRRGHV